MAVVGSVALIAFVHVAPSAAAHGNEAAFHDLPGDQAPTLDVSASAQGSTVTLRLDTTNFAWSKGTAVSNFKAGEGEARVYFDTNRAARIFSPEATFDARAWNLSPGEHVVTVALTGSDLVSYAADGEEVEVTVPFTVGEPKTVQGVEAPDGASFTVTGSRDPFGGWVFSSSLDGFGESVAELEFALNGKPWARSRGGSIHVYPDAIVGKNWQEAETLPVVTVTAVEPDGSPLLSGGTPAALTFAAPVSTEPETWSWSKLPDRGTSRFIVIALLGALIALFAALVLRRKIVKLSKDAVRIC